MSEEQGQEKTLLEDTKPDRKPGQFVPGDPRINRTMPGPGRYRSIVREKLGPERDKNIAFLCTLRDDVSARMRDRLEAVLAMLAYDIGKPAQVIEGDGEQLIVTVRTASGAEPWVQPGAGSGPADPH